MARHLANLLLSCRMWEEIRPLHNNLLLLLGLKLLLLIEWYLWLDATQIPKLASWWLDRRHVVSEERCCIQQCLRLETSHVRLLKTWPLWYDKLVNQGWDSAQLSRSTTSTPMMGCSYTAWLVLLASFKAWHVADCHDLPGHRCHLFVLGARWSREHEVVCLRWLVVELCLLHRNLLNLCHPLLCPIGCESVWWIGVLAPTCLLRSSLSSIVLFIFFVKWANFFNHLVQICIGHVDRIRLHSFHFAE